MALVYRDRVQQLATCEGTPSLGDYEIGWGSTVPQGYRAWSSAVADGDEVYYVATGTDDQAAEWEVGRGTVSVGGTPPNLAVTVSRNTILASSTTGGVDWDHRFAITLSIVTTADLYTQLQALLDAIDAEAQIDGLNAEYLQGQVPADFATDDHNHDADYSPLGHGHGSDEITNESGVTGATVSAALDALDTELAGHDHDGVYSPVGHDHDSDYAPLSHTHDSLYLSLSSAAALAGGRLTLHSTDSAPTADQTAKTTLYYLPHAHDRIGIYDGSAWSALAIPSAGVSITTSGLSASTVYDVFAYSSSGTLTLELLAWTSATTRATALVKQNGVWCKTGALTRRYLGTVYVNASTQFTDSKISRNVWNVNNQVYRTALAQPTSGNHNYTTQAYREFNNDSTLGETRVGVVLGLPTHIDVDAAIYAFNGTGAYCSAGIGLDSSTASIAQYKGNWIDAAGNVLPVVYHGTVAEGYHTVRLLQWSRAAGTTTWQGVSTTNADTQAALVLDLLM